MDVFRSNQLSWMQDLEIKEEEAENFKEYMEELEMEARRAAQVRKWGFDFKLCYRWRGWWKRQK